MLKVGDTITIEATTFKIISQSANSDSWWLQEITSNGMYYYMRALSSVQLKEGLADGSIKHGTVEKMLTIGKAGCRHEWKRYTGLTKVDMYCDCGAKRELGPNEL